MPTQTLPSGADRARSERYRVQRILWEHSTVDKVRACGHHAVNPEGLVGIKYVVQGDGSRRGGFSGLSTCASVWSCPSCNHKIATRRAEQLGEAVRVWEGRAGHVAMVTLTMRHNRSQKLTDLWSAVSKGWARVTSGGAWVADQKVHGTLIDGRVRIPWAKAVEVTRGENGWHVHVHALMFLTGEVDADALGASMFQRWRQGVLDAGFSAPLAIRKHGKTCAEGCTRSFHGGLDVKLIEGSAQVMSGYLTKSTYDVASRAGWEVAGGAMKEGKHGNRSPFEILRSFVDTGDLADLALWNVYEQASFGRRQLTWSRGFRDFLKLDDEATDDEIAGEELDGDTLSIIGADDWKILRAHKYRLLRAVELLPLETLRRQPPGAWLDLLNE